MDAKADALSWVIQPFEAFARGRNLIQSPRLFRFSSASSSALSLCLYSEKTNSQLWIYKVIRGKMWVRMVPFWLDLRVGNRLIPAFPAGPNPIVGGGGGQNLESSVVSTSLETSSREFKVSDHPCRAWTRPCAIISPDTTAPRAQTPAPGAIGGEITLILRSLGLDRARVPRVPNTEQSLTDPPAHDITPTDGRLHGRRGVRVRRAGVGVRGLPRRIRG